MMHNLFIKVACFHHGDPYAVHIYTHVHLHINISIVFENALLLTIIHYECVHKSYVYLHWMHET